MSLDQSRSLGISRHADLKTREDGSILVLPERAIRLGGSGAEILRLVAEERKVESVLNTMRARYPDSSGSADVTTEVLPNDVLSAGSGTEEVPGLPGSTWNLPPELTDNLLKLLAKGSSTIGGGFLKKKPQIWPSEPIPGAQDVLEASRNARAKVLLTLVTVPREYYVATYQSEGRLEYGLRYKGTNIVTDSADWTPHWAGDNPTWGLLPTGSGLTNSYFNGLISNTNNVLFMDNLPGPTIVPAGFIDWPNEGLGQTNFTFKVTNLELRNDGTSYRATWSAISDYGIR